MEVFTFGLFSNQNLSKYLLRRKLSIDTALASASYAVLSPWSVAWHGLFVIQYLPSPAIQPLFYHSLEK